LRVAASVGLTLLVTSGAVIARGLRDDARGEARVLVSTPLTPSVTRSEARMLRASPAPTTEGRPAPRLARVATGHVAVVVGPRVSLEVLVRDRCWLRVRSADGTTLFEGMLEPGQRKMLEAVAPVAARFGNPAGVDVRVNGAALRLSAGPSQPLDADFVPA
jgi:hypothetical protein